MKVLEDYTETYNPESKASDIQQIVYDSETGKYYGKKEEYRCEDGINLERAQSYYIQGDIGNIMRYTSGQFNQDGTFQADGMSDTVRFEKTDKEYSVAEIQHLLTG